jgi:small GTP-binding protein
MSGDTFLFKVVILGESQVGKSSLILRICNNYFSENIPSTAGVADRKLDIELLSRKATLHIWDTAGQERFKGINRMYYRGAKGAILVFDLTNLQSFEKLCGWIREFKDAVVEGELILVGNKVDLVEQRMVDQHVAKAFAAEHNMTYLETSAKTDTMVRESFIQLGEKILAKVMCEGSPECANNTSKLKEDANVKKPKAGCCK